MCVFCGAVEDLLKYLDPQFTDHITLPDAMKLEFILAGKNQPGVNNVCIDDLENTNV